MGKQTGAPLYGGILFIHQEETIMAAFGNMNESEKHYTLVEEVRLQTLHYVWYFLYILIK